MTRASGRTAAWAELLRISALATVPGDALAGAAAAGLRPNRSTLLAIGSSLCLYEAGMALNDWADRAEDAVDRPHRPLPSGRITPRAALGAAALLTAAGLTLAARAGRPSLATATALTATVWSYDLHLKHTPAAPATMATARALNLLLGTVATSTSPSAPGPRRARPRAAAWQAAAAVGAHTYAVTSVSRHETQGGSTRTPLLALATTLALAAALTARRPSTGAARLAPAVGTLVTAALATSYARTPATPLLHAALNPSPPLTQRSVGAGIRALIPLQATLAARAGAPGTALLVLGLAPLARALARKVSPT
ncbi:UbiA family prenyltransferase [Streptomyces sp. Je 1-79]|uniref:SCO3242 family prenyltransferase n=1 Tax=Streptomyces sp. Je 1-79 TaxID=2943847 RepID=UPI0021A68930|nr:UbiA family prenyltransferase [Streptomyces sp. Je 1-79]MCT4353204.1 UbiA family prenyltransferase [Streptomyces sp. Je 1-79]